MPHFLTSPKRTLTKTIALLLYLFFCLASPAQAQQTDRPNIIFLLADDMRHDDMSFIDPSRAYTPNLDRLAAESTVFRNGYVTTAICVVSRVSILTGQYARRHGIYGFRTPIPDEAWQQTYPMLLRQAGYRTGFVGKYGVNIWVPDEQKQYPKDDFDFWFVPGPGSKLYLQDEHGQDVHYTQMLGRKAIEFIQANQDEPFCLSFSFLAPHGSLNPNPEHVAKFANDTIAPPETFGDAYYQLLPEPFHQRPIFGRAERPHLYDDGNHEDHQDYLRGRKNKVYGLDIVVGKLRLELEALGLADNTIIIFSSDHGSYTGAHGLEGKWWMHEESIRTPMIVFDPRLDRSARQKIPDPMVLNIDIAPTILDYAGLPAPASMQGRSFKPWVDGTPPHNWRQEFYYEQHFDLSTTKSKLYIPPVEGVATGRYRYMNYFQDNGTEELYDIIEDPLQINNLVSDPAHQQVLNHLRQRYGELKERLQ